MILWYKINLKVYIYVINSHISKNMLFLIEIAYLRKIYKYNYFGK